MHVIPCIEGRTDDLPVGVAGRHLGLAAARRCGASCWRRGPAGLGTCWTTLHLTEEKEAAELLGIPDARDAGRAHPGRPHARRHRLQARRPARPRPHHPHRRVVMDAELRRHAEAARGFMPPDEGLALHDAAAAGRASTARCSRSAPTAASRRSTWAPRRRSLGRVLFTVDHHRGSEENQPGWEWHEPDLVDPAVGKMDTLPFFRRTIHDAGLEGTVDRRRGRLADGRRRLGHAARLPVHRRRPRRGAGPRRLRALDARTSSPAAPSASTTSSPTPPTAAARPYEQIYLPALAVGRFEEVAAVGSLRVLRRV